jgi:hypothetical protein
MGSIEQEIAKLAASIQGLKTEDGQKAKENVTVMLENAEAARATKQTERALDYCEQVFLPETSPLLSAK